MQIQKFKPSKGEGNGFVLVYRDIIEDERTEGGLYKPQRAIEIANQGEVRAAYDGCQYQSGDRVVFTKYSGSELELNGVMYILIKEREIQGTVEMHEVPDSPSAARPQTAEDVNAAAAEALAKLTKESV
jgi:chaperonin GroES